MSSRTSITFLVLITFAAWLGISSVVADTSFSEVVAISCNASALQAPLAEQRA